MRSYSGAKLVIIQRFPIRGMTTKMVKEKKGRGVKSFLVNPFLELT